MIPGLFVCALQVGKVALGQVFHRVEFPSIFPCYQSTNFLRLPFMVDEENGEDQMDRSCEK